MLWKLFKKVLEIASNYFLFAKKNELNVLESFKIKESFFKG